jgi:predicted phosphodiesterase
MRYLVITDIHGNRFGLEAVLEAAAGEYDALLCLGDVVGYGAHPNECCELVREAGAVCGVGHYLLGNHDAAALGQIDATWFNPVARAAIEWTAGQLTPQNRDWLSSLSGTMEDSTAQLQATHGSLRQPLEEYIVNPEVALETFNLMEQPLCFYGHTHVADCYELRISETRSLLGRKSTRPELRHAALRLGGRVEMEENASYLINPGSCGQPRDGNPQARYAIYDVAERMIEILALDYTIQAAHDAITDAGLPTMLADRLLVGR